MSYVRFSEADVYVFGTDTPEGKRIECCGCRLSESLQHFATFTDAIAHLNLHREEGHDVPQRVFDDLAAERDEFGDSLGGAW